MTHAESIADYKAISMNVMYSSMEITDEFYSNLNDEEVAMRLGALGKENKLKSNDENVASLNRKFIIWRKGKK